MQVFKTFFKVLRKYYGGMSIYFGICAVMLIISTSMNNKTEDYSQQSYDIYVDNQDDSEIAACLYDYLSDIHTVKQGSFSPDEKKDMLYYEEIVCSITIPQSFGNDFTENNGGSITCMKDDAQPYGIYVENQINAYLAAVAAYSTAGYSIEEADALTREDLETEAAVTTKGQASGQSKLYTFYNFLPYVILSLVLAGVLPVVLAFNRTELRKRTNVSATPVTQKNSALVLAALLVSLILWLILIGAFLCLDTKEILTEKGGLAILNSFVFVVVSVCMMAFISNFRLSGASVSMLSNIVGLSFSFLGGTFVPLSYLGKGVKAVAKFLPNYWYSLAIEKIDAGAPLRDVAGYLGMELLFGLILLVLGFVLGKIILQRKTA